MKHQKKSIAIGEASVYSRLLGWFLPDDQEEASAQPDAKLKRIWSRRETKTKFAPVATDCWLKNYES